MTGFKLYKSYSFKDKDPVIDRLRTIIADEGMSYSKVSEHSGVSAHTLYQWFNGATKRPQFATVMAVARTLGYDLKLTRDRKFEVVREPKPITRPKLVKQAGRNPKMASVG